MRDNKMARRAVEYIQSFIGLPYRWGGENPLEGFDCSGLAIEMLKSVGLLPHNFDTTAHGLYDKYKLNKPDNQTAKTGCLVFYASNDLDSFKIVHVGIAIDNKLMIEAGGGNSKTVDVETAKDQNAYIRMRPIDYRDGYTICDPFQKK